MFSHCENWIIDYASQLNGVTLEVKGVPSTRFRKQDPNLAKIMIKEKENFLVLRVYFQSKILHVNIEQGTDTNLLNIACQFMNEFIIKLEGTSIYIPDHDLNIFPDKAFAMQYLVPLKYQKITYYMAALLKRYQGLLKGGSGYFFDRSDFDRNRLYLDDIGITEGIKNVKKQNPTLDASFTAKGLLYYYEGEESIVNFNIVERSLSFTRAEKQETIFLTTKQKFHNAVRIYFDMIKKENRLNNMLHPPTRHFDQKLKSQSSYLFANFKSLIYAILSQKHPWFEIEDRCAKEGNRESGRTIRLSKNKIESEHYEKDTEPLEAQGYVIYVILDHIFFFDKSNDTLIKHGELADYGAISNLFLELSELRIREQLKTDIAEFYEKRVNKS
jgi:hypothetical protein